MKTALIDGDIILYRAGFAAEETTYLTEDGAVHATLGAAKKHCATQEQDPTHIIGMTEAEPVSHALKLAKNMILRSKKKTKAKGIRIFLGGATNFRNEITTIREYKGGRTRKPIHYQAIKNYLIEVHDAEVIEGMEADDALGIYQTGDTCICTIDKDLNQVPGCHYNFISDNLYSVTPVEAINMFYTQLLTGDPVDCIVGVPGVGKVRAKRIVDKCTDVEDLYWSVLEEYEKKYPRPFEALLENARLLYILREHEVMWEPPC